MHQESFYLGLSIKSSILVVSEYDFQHHALDTRHRATSKRRFTENRRFSHEASLTIF